MARTWTPASSSDMRVKVGPSSAETWGPITILIVCRRATDSAINCTLSIDSSVPATKGHTGVMNSNQMLFNNEGVEFNADGPTQVASQGWVMMGWTKASGSVAPRFHLFRYNQGAASLHMNSGDPFPNLTAPGVGGFWRIGTNSFSEEWDGPIAAVCAIKRVLTDMEIDNNAPRGDWWRFNPILWEEFRSGVGNPDGGGRNVGSDNTNNTVVTAITRSAEIDPPGFKFSAHTRRRH